MRTRALGLLGVLVLLGGAFSALPAYAQDPAGDSATVSVSDVRLGQPVLLRIEVLTAPGSTVELDPASASWGAVTVLGVDSQEEIPEGEQIRHVLLVRVAAFDVGPLQFQPVVNVVTGPETAPRQLPGASVNVIESLAPDAALELSPLAPPVGIGGAESPFLKPLIAVGIAAGLALLALLTYLAARVIARRPRGAAAAEPARPIPDLSTADALLDSDPVGAYRTLAAAVRRHLSEQYGFPATALTASELERRMETVGVDRWEARLVGGLLKNCDAVVYAGYRPAFERRQADLTMAREIVEAGA